MLTVVSDRMPASARSAALRRCRINYVKGDAASPATLREVNVDHADSVLVLQRGHGEQEDDAHSLLCMQARALAPPPLHPGASPPAHTEIGTTCVQAVREALSQRDGTAASEPRIVGELGDPHMVALISQTWPAQVKDLVLPNELGSGLLVQFALQPRLRQARAGRDDSLPRERAVLVRHNLTATRT